MPEIKPHKNQSDSLKLPLHRENKVVVYHKLTICAYVFLVLHTTNSQDGPMVVGLAPQDASDRLIMFQVQYPVIYHACFHKHKHNMIVFYKMLCNMFCWYTYNDLLLEVFTKMVWCSTESLWQPFPQVHHIHRWRGPLWPTRYPASSVAWDQETVDTSPKALWTLQQCHRHCQRLLWHFMGRHQYWQNQQWTTWVSVEVRRLQKSN